MPDKKKSPLAGFAAKSAAARAASPPQRRPTAAEPTAKPGPPRAAPPAPAATPQERRAGRALGTKRLTVDVYADELEKFRALAKERRDPQTLVLRVALRLLEEASPADYERIADDLAQQ